MNEIITSVRKFGLAFAILFTSSAYCTALSAETTFDKIKKTGQVTVGTEAAFPPFEFVQDGKIVGYGKDILDIIIADLGVERSPCQLAKAQPGS